MILFGQNISRMMRFVMSRNLDNYALFKKPRLFSEMKKLTVGKMFDLYTNNRTLSNVQCKFALYSLSFFSLFYVKPYNTGAIHSYIHHNSFPRFFKFLFPIEPDRKWIHESHNSFPRFQISISDGIQ